MKNNYKVLDIRGTHGSGKSYIPIKLLEMYDHVEWRGHPFTYDGPEGTLGYYIKALNLTIIGKYATACGGCDGIKTQAEIRERVAIASRTSNVLLEGILVAHTFGPWEEYSRPWGDTWNFCFLNTPLLRCVDNVNSRRALAGKEPLADPKNIVRDHGRIWALKPKFEEAGRNTRWLNHETSVTDLLAVLS